MTEGCVLITYESADAATQAQQARCMLASSLLCKVESRVLGDSQAKRPPCCDRLLLVEFWVDG